MQATAMGKSLSSDIDKLKVSLETSEKHRQRLEAVFDNEKQTATDLKRQLKLDIARRLSFLKRLEQSVWS